MPTQASALSKGYSRPLNPWFMFKTIVIFTANIKVQLIMNLCLLTTAVYQVNLHSQEK